MDELEQLADTPDSNAAGNAAAEEQHHDEQLNGDQVNPNSEEQIEEDEEVEIGGKKVAMPKSIAAEIKAGTMRQADYTQKTQAVAEDRKGLASEREQFEQHKQQQQQFIKDVAKVHALDDALEQFKGLDWMTLSAEDPVRVQQLQIQYQQLQQQRNEAAQAVTQKQNEHALAEQQNLAKQVQEAEAYVQREIPGWNQERAKALNDYASGLGVKVDQGFARAVVQNPALLLIMDKAEKFDQLVKKQATKPQAPAAPPPPVPRVGATRAAAKVDPAKLSTSDWMEQRNKQLRAKR